MTQEVAARKSGDSAAASSPARLAPAVRPGDTVAVVAPSAPGVHRWPHRADQGRKYLESLGLRVRLMPNAQKQHELPWLSASGPERAADVNEAFADDSVRAVLAATGGYHSIDLLPHLDYDTIRANPTIFHGYSDVTVVHWALLRMAGLRTFYGPSFLMGLAEHPRVLRYADLSLRDAWMNPSPLSFAPAAEWTDEFLDFDTRADLERPRRLRQNPGWHTIRPGVAEGQLLVGCLETVAFVLPASSAWLDLEGALLALEPSDATSSAAVADGALAILEHLGVFSAISGLVVGRPSRYDALHRELFCRAVERRTAQAGIPVLANVDFGHTDPALTLPHGVRARLDAGDRVFETLEAATAASDT